MAAFVAANDIVPMDESYNDGATDAAAGCTRGSEASLAA